MFNCNFFEIIDGRWFVTIIGAPGVPASVNMVTNRFGESGPLLHPYPDWSWYDSSNGCNRIVSVYRVAVSMNKSVLIYTYMGIIIKRKKLDLFSMYFV